MWMLPLAYGGPSCSTNFGAPLRRVANLPVEVHRRPAGERLGLARRQVRLHREVGARQVDGVFPLGHGYPDFITMSTNGIRMRRATTLDNGLKVLIQEEHTAPLASVWCWYKVGLEGRTPGPDRRVALGRAHELQGHDQHPARSGERDHRAVRRQLERLHLDRSDDVSRDGDARRARSHAVHRIRADGELPLPSGRLRVGAHGDHLRAAGRRERSRSAARSGADRDGVQGASVPASDDRLAVGSADDDARRSVRLLPPLLRPEQRDAGDRRRRRYRRRAAPRRALLRRHRAGRRAPSACARSSRSRPANAA